MINLISKNNKATNAPDHPVYMMCIRVAYAHAYVRARVCGLVCICMYTSIVDFDVDISLKRNFFNQRVSNYLVCLFTPL